MANSEHVKIIKQGADTWNEWRKNNPDINPDLAWANLIGLDLQGIDFTGSILYGTNLQNAVLNSATMKNADLEGANLIDAVLENANLEGANMKLAVLDRANCRGTNLLNTKKLGYKQLMNAATLANANLEANVYDKLKAYYPDLFSGES